MKKTLTPLRIVLALVVMAAVIAGIWWWLARDGGAEKRYRTEALRTGDVTQTVSANGTLNPVVLVNVGTQVSGTVKKLHADFNAHVKAGQVLLELDPSVLQAQVHQSEANLASATASFELARSNEVRSRSLFSQEYISKQEFDQAVQALKSAQAQVNVVKAQLARDRTNLNYSVIRSPVSGVVVNRTVDVGQTVAASFQTPTLFQIAQDLSKMQIDSSFAEADIGKIKVDQPVRFGVDAFPNRIFNATVKQIRLNATTQQNVVTYDVVVAVDNSEQILMPGMTAYVNVIVAERRNVLLAPNAALRFRPDDGREKGAGKVEGKDAAKFLRRKREERGDASQANVYVLDQGKLRAQPIRIGISDGRVTEIVSDELKAGDPVVVGVAASSTEQSQSTFRMRMF